jgi:diketogulonate reductase-like aldo/keto reductase
MESDYITLNTGAHMPLLGLGTWNADPKTVGSAVEFALTEAGYRHIDCAFVYHNEVEVGQAFHKVFSANVARREDVFITSKLWSTAHRASAVLESCKQSLHDLQLEYLDLYLVHFPIAIKPGNGDEPLGEDGYVLTEKVSLQETWEAMEGLVKSGLVKNIGVSNYSATHILDLLTYAKVTPAVNQIELHPYLSQ